MFTDNVKVVRVTSTKISGDTFPEGDTNVNYDAYDESGNKESCSFVVRLKRKSFAHKDLFCLFVCLCVCLFCFVESLCSAFFGAILRNSR